MDTDSTVGEGGAECNENANMCAFNEINIAALKPTARFNDR